MHIDWIMGLIGGVMIGAAAALYLLINGRVMGASGIIGGVVDGSAGRETTERMSFLGGLFITPAVAAYFFVEDVSTHVSDNLWAIIAAGLMVGIGTRLANGCTSGHGICGISRLSVRGIAATVFYIAAGGVSVTVFRHWLGVI